MADEQTLPKPPIVTYNLKERGRKYRGKERNFNIAAITNAINSPYTQERVKTRAMLGYFGHKIRQLAGLEPVESVIIGGKYNEVEPAIVTTYLEAFPDGTIKHQTEFLDNGPGRKAAQMWANRIGGFSSAIDESKPEFYGLDYVLDPNYSGNRGFSLDSIGGEITFDSVMAEAANEQEEFWRLLVAKKDHQLNEALAALDSCQVENEQLMSLLSAKTGDDNITLDSASQMPVSISLDSTQRLLNDREHFWNTPAKDLPKFADPVVKDAGKDQGYNQMLARMGINGV